MNPDNHRPFARRECPQDFRWSRALPRPALRDPEPASQAVFHPTTKLDAITNEDIQRLKMRLRENAPKTVNNVISVLNRMLKVAVEWGVIDRMPCSIRLLKTPKPKASFHDGQAYEALVKAAVQLDWRAELIVFSGRSRAPVRRDDGARVAGRRPPTAPGLCAAIGLEGSSDIAERRAAAARPAQAMKGAPARAIQELAYRDSTRR